MNECDYHTTPLTVTLSENIEYRVMTKANRQTSKGERNKNVSYLTEEKKFKKKQEKKSKRKCVREEGRKEIKEKKRARGKRTEGGG